MKLELWHVSGDGFHFGRHGLEQEESGVHFPSDSLFGALIARMAELFGDAAVAAFGKPFLAGEPPLVLTSAFPRAGDVLFFPPPLYRKLADEVHHPGLRTKDLKKVQFVSEGLFRKLLKGESLAAIFGETLRWQDGKALLLAEETDKLPPAMRVGPHKIWKVTRRPHVTIGRATPNSTLFHTGRTSFNTGCGLWFGIQWLDRQEDLSSKVMAAFTELGDAGLGGERSRGYGASTIEKMGEVQLPGKEDGSPWVTLSRYLPRDQAETIALQHAQAAYAIETVHGWISSPAAPAQRRRTVNMLTEGSVLGPVDTNPPGQMVDVQPDYDGNRPMPHPVWRNGMACAIGLQV